MKTVTVGLSWSALLVLLAPNIVLAQSTAFTYQGRLEEGGGVPANGSYGFVFRLFDSLTDGQQVSDEFCQDVVPVVNGLFTLELDFGQQFSTGEERFLDVQLREDGNCADTSGFVQLAPRQRITATPLALHALEANVAVQAESAGLAEHAGFADLANAARRLDAPDGSPASAVSVDNNGNVGIGTTTPAAKLDVRGDIRLGPTGQFRAATGEENLRIIRGLVSEQGTVVRGSGFTAVRNGEGLYTIVFNTPFAAPPTVCATIERTSTFTPRQIIQVNDATTSVVGVLGFFAGDGSGLDMNFHFIAVGPR